MISTRAGKAPERERESERGSRSWCRMHSTSPKRARLSMQTYSRKNFMYVQYIQSSCRGMGALRVCGKDDGMRRDGCV